MTLTALITWSDVNDRVNNFTDFGNVNNVNNVNTLRQIPVPIETLFFGPRRCQPRLFWTKAVPIETMSVYETRFRSRHFLGRGGSNRNCSWTESVPWRQFLGTQTGSNRDTFWTEAVPIETTVEQRRFQSRQFLWTKTGSNRDTFRAETVPAETVC